MASIGAASPPPITTMFLLLCSVLVLGCFFAVSPACAAIPRSITLYRSARRTTVGPFAASKTATTSSTFDQNLELVTLPPLLLSYRNGPVLSGIGQSGIAVYLLWYGSFTPAQRVTVADFFHSLDTPRMKTPSAHAVSSWWKTTSGYRDSTGVSVATSARLAGEAFDAAHSVGKVLKTGDLEGLVKSALHAGTFPASASAVYFVLTAADVAVEGFCMSSCGYHAYLYPSKETGERMLPYAWVGNAATQCPGQCAWPFATPQYGPPAPPLRSPNADLAIDGMIINIATVLAGMATNPFDTGYFQGDVSEPLEAVSACTGIFGKGAYPGYPGELLVHNGTGSSYNTEGINNRRFLVPAMWNPATLTCTTL